MTRLAVDFPAPEFIIFAVAILLAVIGKIVDVAKKVREKSIEAEQRGEAQFGFDLGEAAEPQPAGPAPRLELGRRPPRPRHQEPVFVAAPAPPPPRHAPARVAPAPPKPREHEIVRLLRTPKNARTAVLLVEVLGPPKALRRDTARGPMLRNS